MVLTLGKGGAVTAAGVLSALDFKTTVTPVFDNQGKEIEGYRRIYRADIDRTLAVMSDKYQLVEHMEAIEPAVEAMGKEGWTIARSHVERFGASAFVELVRKDKTIKVVGEKVGERVLLRNTYDGTSSLRLSFGAIVLACSNGAVVPGVGFAFDAHHTGDIHDRLGALTAKVRKIEEGLGARMIESYSKLDSPVPLEIGKEIVRRVLGERKMEQPLQYWKAGLGRNGEATAWNLYNGITQYLTHDFTGAWGRRERKNGQAFDLLAQYLKDGRLPKSEDADAN